MKKTMMIAAIMMIVANVHAGTIQIRDEVNLLSSADRNIIEHSAGDWPFDLRLVISNSSRNKSAFEGEISREVVGPRTLAVGVDPLHRFTVVRFGVGLSVPSDEWNRISQAGNNAFRSKFWGKGITDIGDMTASLAHLKTSEPIYVAREIKNTGQDRVIMMKPTVSDNAAMWWMIGILGFATVILVGAFIIHRRRQKEIDRQRALKEELDSAERIIAADSYKPSAWRAYPDTPTQTSSTAPIRPIQASSPVVDPARVIVASPPVIQQVPSITVRNDSTADGIATGMMLSEMMHDHHHHHHSEPERVIERVVERRSERNYDDGGASSSFSSSSSSDSGGSSSSWDSSASSSSSSWDSGGSSSSFDSSSSGSSDSGGGSSDW